MGSLAWAMHMQVSIHGSFVYPNVILTAEQPTGNATGHPAICEPVTSADCKTKNSWLTSCDAAGMTTAAPTTTAANTTAAPKTTTSSAVSTKAAFVIPFTVSVVMAALR